tara:strand:+ start:11231 stop:11848 length:618 start_codon:yes stop_codon:yes gene_type:complete
MNIEVKNSEKPVDYNESMLILEKRVADVLSGKKDELLWILEHNTVYTAGSSSNKRDLIDKNIKVIRTKRGGKHTLHSPGQKVVYFVLNLNKREKNIRTLVHNIENCIIETLKEYNVFSYADKKNIGIWVGDKNNSKKIAAIGIRVKKWIAYHGFSLNISNDLSKYKKIIPCGITNKGVTNLKEMDIKNYNNIDKIIIKKFLNIFL